MKLVIQSPTVALIERISDAELDLLRTQLTYTNTSKQHQLKRLYQNAWFKSKNREGWEQQIEALKKEVKNTLVFEGKDGKFIRPASIPYLKGLEIEIENKINYPTPKKVAWAKQLPFELHYYQEESWQMLLQEKHANVELCTSAGKSAILLKLCRETGFKTAIIAPSKSIFNELVKAFKKYLGDANVGTFGDGKKKLGKRFTICIGDSLANIKRDTPEWEFFSGLDMICVDESHLWGAESMEEVCHGVLANAPYRFFFSGTQTRNDGSETLLQSIIGKTVYHLPTWKAVQGGFISKHGYKVVSIESSNPYFNSNDVLEMKRAHFLNNRNIAAFIAKLANAEAASGKQTLVLVEELTQISMLIPLLKVPFAYAHSESKKDRLAELGLQKVDPDESVEKFNKGEVKVLIGTSCISTGTNIFPTHHTFNWQGGASEIKTKQGAVGRSVRLSKHNPFADKCLPKEKSLIWDFDIYDIYVLNKHLEDRVSYYKDSFPPGEEADIQRISLNAKAQATGGIR